MVVVTDPRDAVRDAFRQLAGVAGRAADALPRDCSFRQYFRLAGDPALLLMDAPPPTEDVRPYIAVAEHLNGLGLSAPKVVASDVEQGFAIIEDFGNATYTRLLAEGGDERALYELAVDVLIALHGDTRAAAIELPPYDEKRLLDEARLLVDWYMPWLTGKATPADITEAYLDAWCAVIRALPPIQEPGSTTLVLRDYHVDNLMLLEDRGGVARCGLLDFQDALIGHPAYDLMSLLEDARRDVDQALQTHLLARYAAAFPKAASDDFQIWYTVLAAQRHAKVTGIFTRQDLRDGKPVYLPHMPRVVRLLRAALARDAASHGVLGPVAAWVEKHLPADA